MFQAEKTSLFCEFVHNGYRPKIVWLLKRLFVNFISTFIKAQGQVFMVFAEG